MANNSKDILKKTQELLSAKAAEKELERTRVERERRELITSLSQDIAAIVGPAINNLAMSQEVTFNKMRQMLREIKIEAPRVPEIKIPNITVPQPKVQVNVPDVKIPAINIPKPDPIQFPERMSVTMDSVDNTRPLPVIMMDTKGKPMPFSMGAGGGGKADYITIKDIRTSMGASAFNADGQLRVTGDLTVVGSATSTYAQLVNADGTYYDSDNPLPITGSLSTTPGATFYASDAIASTNLIQVGGNPVVVGTGYQDNALRVVHATDAIASVNVVSSATLTVDATSSGDVPITLAGESVVVSSITASTATNIVDSTGVAYSGSNPIPVGDAGGSLTVDGTVAVSGISGTTGTNVVDSSGVAYSGSNPVPVSLVTSAVASTAVVGIVASDAADTGSNPVKVGGIARQANPTAVAAGDMVSATYDDIGRQVMRPLQVRDLITTAYTSLSTGTETTLISGVASTYLDLIYVTCANQSDAAVYVDFRCGTAGAVVLTVEVPAEATAGVALPVPIPMPEAAQSWTVDMDDITGTTVDISALFSKEV